MLPLRYLTVAYIVLALYPVMVTSQLYLKVVICLLSSGYFRYQGCAEDVNIICRLIALEMKVVNCRSYPCVNYGSNENNACTAFPTGCPLEYIKMFGMCPAFKICCGTGGESPYKSKEWKPHQLWNRLGFKLGSRRSSIVEDNDGSRNQNLPPTITSWNETAKEADVDFKQLPPGLNLPEDPKDYIRDWPKNVTDPLVLESAIRVQYERFALEIAAINDEGLKNGMDPIRVVSYEDFRAVGLGEKEINQV